jgi:hypothetical protein
MGTLRNLNEISKPLALETETSRRSGLVVGSLEEESFTGDCERNFKHCFTTRHISGFHFMFKSGLWKLASLSIGVLHGAHLDWTLREK